MCSVCRRVALRWPLERLMKAYDDMITTGRLLWEEGLVTSHGGNLSVRVSQDRILITKTGTKLGTLEISDLIEVPLSSDRKEFPEASSELVVHQAIYTRTGAKAVVHAHPPYTVAMAEFTDEIVPRDVEGRLTYGKCPVVSVEKPHASEELAEAVAEALKKCKIVCVKGHGTFAVGKSLDEALFLTSSLEFSCKLLFITYTMKARL